MGLAIVVPGAAVERMSARRGLTLGEKHLLALVGKGNQAPVQLGLTPRELETIANALDTQAAEYHASAEAVEPSSVDEIVADADHVADLCMLRDRLRHAYEDQIA